jgi:predicted aspartyl protease
LDCFYTDIIVLNLKNDGRKGSVHQLLVHAGSNSTWIPEAVLESIGVERRKKDHSFQVANGQIVIRDIGYARLEASGFKTVDEVVFAEADDVPLLGSRTLGGFNARVDPVNKRLVSAGPIPAAGNISKS